MNNNRNIGRNVESHFGNIPSTNMRRSKFKRNCRHLTSFNTGDIIPIYRDEVLAGDTAKINESFIVYGTTPIVPVMDNAWIDTYYFFVPERLVWEHFPEFLGENTTDEWTQTVQYVEPKTSAPNGGWAKGSIASYMGARINTDGVWINSKWLRAYTLIYNEWFRNENVSEPAALSKGDSNSTGTNGTDYVNDIELGGMPAKAVKYADYFTRALPEPQKGPDVFLPLGQQAPVLTGAANTGDTGISAYPLYWYDTTTKNLYQPTANTDVGVMVNNGATEPHTANSGSAGNPMAPINLYADLENATAATIGQLRQALAVQRLYETDARGGTRMCELLSAHFGVTNPDARLQRPEYIDGKRVPINITAVEQNSSTDNVSPLGTLGAYSKTVDNHGICTYSATEPGMIIGLAVIRTEHTYQQGIDRILQRNDKLSYYWPELANISEQYIKNGEIFAQGTSKDLEAFGYQEPWAEYRYATNRITGELNSDYSSPLDIYHYGDDYSTLPTLSHDWIVETKANVQRTLAVANHDQWIADFYFDQTWTRPMPIYGIPGITGWH